MFLQKSITATIPTSTKQRSVTHVSSQKRNLSG
jgi:hypothetical protein